MFPWNGLEGLLALVAADFSLELVRVLVGRNDVAAPYSNVVDHLLRPLLIPTSLQDVSLFLQLNLEPGQ